VVFVLFAAVNKRTHSFIHHYTVTITAGTSSGLADVFVFKRSSDQT